MGHLTQGAAKLALKLQVIALAAAMIVLPFVANAADGGPAAEVIAAEQAADVAFAVDGNITLWRTDNEGADGRIAFRQLENPDFVRVVENKAYFADFSGLRIIAIHPDKLQLQWGGSYGDRRATYRYTASLYDVNNVHLGDVDFGTHYTGCWEHKGEAVVLGPVFAPVETAKIVSAKISIKSETSSWCHTDDDGKCHSVVCDVFNGAGHFVGEVIDLVLSKNVEASKEKRQTIGGGTRLADQIAVDTDKLCPDLGKWWYVENRSSYHVEVVISILRNESHFRTDHYTLNPGERAPLNVCSFGSNGDRFRARLKDVYRLD